MKKLKKFSIQFIEKGKVYINLFCRINYNGKSTQFRLGSKSAYEDLNLVKYDLERSIEYIIRRNKGWTVVGSGSYLRHLIWEYSFEIKNLMLELVTNKAKEVMIYQNYMNLIHPYFNEDNDFFLPNIIDNYIPNEEFSEPIDWLLYVCDVNSISIDNFLSEDNLKLFHIYISYVYTYMENEEFRHLKNIDILTNKDPLKKVFANIETANKKLDILPKFTSKIIQSKDSFFLLMIARPFPN